MNVVIMSNEGFRCFFLSSLWKESSVVLNFVSVPGDTATHDTDQTKQKDVKLNVGLPHSMKVNICISEDKTQ